MQPDSSGAMEVESYKRSMLKLVMIVPTDPNVLLSQSVFELIT
jgi:hypothetical protein